MLLSALDREDVPHVGVVLLILRVTLPFHPLQVPQMVIEIIENGTPIYILHNSFLLVIHCHPPIRKDREMFWHYAHSPHNT